MAETEIDKENTDQKIKDLDMIIKIVGDCIQTIINSIIVLILKNTFLPKD